LPTHYSVWFEPPDESGDEVLHIVSARRSLKLKGHSFREFHRRVLPLLDGRHSLEAIEQETADLFRPEDLSAALAMLSEQGVLVEGDEAELGVDPSARIATQLNFFHELKQSAADAQQRLAAATVAVFGLGGAGAATVLALGAAGVGTLRCIDALPIAKTDVYLSPFFTLDEVGRGRAISVAARVRASAPEVRVVCIDQPVESEDDVRSAISGAGFVVCCLDQAQSNLAYKLNRVCLADGLRWISCSLDGTEVTVGPAIHPGQSACYLCYQMRLVACAGNPEDSFAFQKYLDRRKSDDSGRRENLVFGAGLAANLLGVEVLKELTELAEPSLVGRILTVGLTDLSIQKHAVLRKPWCPACFPKAESDHGG
jgi:molybdopterin-synthase adenylyltransferase